MASEKELLFINGYNPFDKERNNLKEVILSNRMEIGLTFLEGIDYKPKLSRSYREKIGQEMLTVLNKKNISTIKHLSGVSYGGEVLVSFFKANKESEKPIKINSISFVATPVTHYLVNQIKYHNLLDNVKKCYFFYSKKDKVQVGDFTQSFCWSDKFGIWFTICHNLSKELSEKIVHIDISSAIFQIFFL